MSNLISLQVYSESSLVYDKARLAFLYNQFFTDDSKSNSDEAGLLDLTTIGPGTELYLLEKIELAKGQYTFLGEVNSGPQKGQKLWIAYDSHQPDSKLFSNDLKDMLATPTMKIEDAYYVFTTKQKTAYADNESWVSVLNQLNAAQRDCFEKHRFEDLEKSLTATGRFVEIEATDTEVACPEPPQQRNAKACGKSQKLDLNTKAKEYIRVAADKYGIHPALLAAMIHKESLWNPFIDNQAEKNRCLSKGDECPDYRWSRGLGQFGKQVAEQYGLDWTNADGKLERPQACGKTHSAARSFDCFNALEKQCEVYKDKKLKPISCPQFAIEATAQHLVDAMPKEMNVWVRENGQVVSKDLMPVLTATQAESFRNQISFFQRGVRVFNSYVEHYDQTGKWPQSYGEAWSTPRIKEGEILSPSTEMGYQMLTNEFVNRCHIWSLAGLCGEIPDDSLIGQYMQDFK